MELHVLIDIHQIKSLSESGTGTFKVKNINTAINKGFLWSSDKCVLNKTIIMVIEIQIWPKTERLV